MSKKPTYLKDEVVREINQAEKFGAHLFRVAVPDKKALESLKFIKRHSLLPIIADVHFNPSLALKVIEQGIDKLRINPGNINRKQMYEIIKLAKERSLPIRIGVNSGSLPEKIQKKYLHPSRNAIVETVENTIKFFEDNNFFKIVISAKTSNWKDTKKINEILYKKFPYPLHIGVTEAGLIEQSAVFSTVALVPLLKKGIGDTIRISISGPVEQEVEVAYNIIRASGKKINRIRFIACPGCGRAEVNIWDLSKKLYSKVVNIKRDISIACMGCIVNGPGEAKESDYGIAGGKGKGIIFKKGKKIAVVKENKLIDYLINIIEEDV